MLLDYTEMPKEGKQSRFAYLEFREHGMTPLQGILDFFSCAENSTSWYPFLVCVCTHNSLSLYIYISLSKMALVTYCILFGPFICTVLESNYYKLHLQMRKHKNLSAWCVHCSLTENGKKVGTA